MVTSLRKITKAAIADYETKPRHEWATCHPSQVSLSHEQTDQMYRDILAGCTVSISTNVV